MAVQQHILYIQDRLPGTLRNRIAAGIFPGSGNFSPEERKQLVSQVMTGPLHTAAWLFPVVTQPTLCRTLQGSWELPLRNWLLLATRVSLVEICFLGMPVVY